MEYGRDETRLNKTHHTERQTEIKFINVERSFIFFQLRANLFLPFRDCMLLSDGHSISEHHNPDHATLFVAQLTITMP
ncbi:hypothetical protein EUGRSUZ_A02738 [Eucalyptus grandis]|uniref:Uncharacterized protein n=2 Tax=Eucalyptus grandis TaxID=71139 RepID=A0ACC3M6Z2_EUCGR|nr:hypothetical protein EUGRSUZ_A02738 [Eucalyptus grandis]